MRTTLAKLVAVSAGLLPVSVQAQSASEQQNRSLRTLRQVNVPPQKLPAKPCAKTCTTAERLRLIGQPIGSDRIDIGTENRSRVTLTMQINNDEDRVGARAYVCSDDDHVVMYAEHAGDCGVVITYVFPMLRYDKIAKKVYWGNKLIARDYGTSQGGLRLVDGYEYEKVPRLIDQGFDRYVIQALEVSLVQVPVGPQS